MSRKNPDLTAPQRVLAEFMFEQGRPIVRLRIGVGNDQFYCGQAAGNMVKPMVALGLIIKGLVDEQPYVDRFSKHGKDASNACQYILNERGIAAIGRGAAVIPEPDGH